MRLTPTKYLVFFVLIAAVVAGCGYRVSVKSERFAGTESLAIPVFKNETRKADAENVITSAIIDELVSTFDITGVDDADAVVRGVVTNYDLEPITYGPGDIASEYRLSVDIFVSIEDRKGNVIWKADRLGDYENFFVSTSNVLASRQSELNALGKIAHDLARLLRERAVEGY